MRSFNVGVSLLPIPPWKVLCQNILTPINICFLLNKLLNFQLCWVFNAACRASVVAGAILYLQCTSFSLRRRQWHPTPVLLPGKSHGWRSLVGCSPWGRQESDMTERLHFQFSLSCIGEGNGNPLQCSCLENPRAGGAWWAAVYGVGHD